MYETYERFWRQNVYFCLFDCSTIYCATIRVLSQCTLDVFQEVYYAQNIGLSQVRHVYLSDYKLDLYICRTTGTTCIFVGLQQYSQVRHVYLSDYRYDMCICRTTGSTYIFVGLPIVLWCLVQHIYLLDYLILLGHSSQI